MRKLYLLAWMMMLSIAAMAQTIVVVDKQGNRISYDPAEVSSVEFTTNPAGFIVNKYAGARQYFFDKVKSIEGLPNYLFNNPDTIYLSSSGGAFSFEVNANVEYDATPSERWMTFVGQDGNKQKYSASGNDGKWRKGYIAFVSKDQQLTDTLWVLQAGKADPDITYIDYEMYSLKSVTPDQDIYVGFVSSGGGGGSGNVVIPASGYKARFQLTHTEGIFWHPVVGDIINLEAEKGTCTPTVANTDAEGQVEVEFFPQSLTIDKGTVKATNSQVFNSGESWRGEATVTFSFKDVYQFECLTPEQDVPKGEESAVKFKLMRYANGGWRPAANATVTAKLVKATFAGSTDITTVTNIDGEATIRFVPDDIMPCVGSVVATCEVTLGDGRHATSTQTAEFAVAEEFKIEAAVPKIYSENSETNTVRFTIYEKNGGQWVKNPHDVEVTYSAVNGKLSRNKETVKDDASVDFTPDASFSDTNPGSVTASCSILLSNGKTWTGDATTNVLFENQYRLDCSDPQFIAPDGETPVEFRLMRNVNGQWEPFAGQDIAFAVAPGGTCSPGIVKTDAEGKAITNFKMMDGFTTSSLRAGYSVVDADGITHSGSKTANLVLLKYKMRANNDEVYIDGTNDYRPLFYLFEYINGEWKGCEKEIPATFKATGGTVDKNEPFDRGVSIVTFHPEKDFKEGSVTAQCDIELGGGFVWHGEAVTKLVKEEQYKIERVQPEENETEIAWDEIKTVKFRVLKKEDSGYQPVHLANVYFDCVDGECSLDRELTDEEGIASTLFTLETGKSEGSIKATYHILDNNGIWHYGSETASFIIPLYKLKPNREKVAVKNDGSKQQCYFDLYEYQNGKWEMCQKEVEFNFEATGVTLSETSRMNEYGGTYAGFTAEKDFKEGSITAKCDIELEDGRVWHGDATAELILDNYQFSRVLPEDNPTEIYPDERQNVVFSLMKLVNGTYQPCQGQEVEFNSQDGTLVSGTVYTDGMGKATTSFKINPDFKTANVYARCSFTDEQGVYHFYDENVKFVKNPYKMNTNREKVAVKNDGSKQQCYFDLYEYQNGKWGMCQKEVEINFEATGVTLSETSRMNEYGGTYAGFTAEKDFKEGSITAKCDIELAKDYVWHGVATAELILDDYQFSRVLPEDNPAGIYPDEGQNVVFSLMKLVNGTYQPCQGQEVEFNSQSGTLVSGTVNTDGMGKATTKFKINPDVKTANVYARCSFTDEQGVYHFYDENVKFILIPYRLKCLTPEVEMKKSDGTATIRYELLEYKKGEWVACPDKKLVFTATNGSAQPDYALTNENGICQTVFTPTEGATEGTVTGTCTIVVNEKDNFVWTQSQAAHITIIDDGTGDRPSKEKAKPKIRILDEGSGGNKPKVIDDNGNGEIVFVVEERIEGEDADRPVEGAKVEFETDNQDDNLEGFSWATSGKDGKATCKFMVPESPTHEPYQFQGFNLKAKATIRYSDGEKVVETTVKVNSDGTLDTGGGGGDDPCGGGISDSDLKKAYELEQNTFKIGGKVTKLDGPEDMIEWSVTENNEGQKFNSVNWFKEDPVYYTTAWGTIYGFPDDMYGEEIYWSEGSGMSISFGAFIDPSAGYSETNVVDFNSENIQKAVFRLCKDANGNIFAIAYVRSKDGNEGTFKVKAKPAGAENTPCDTGDELLNKADQQDNSVVVKNKTTGATEIRDFDLYKCEFNWTTDNLSFTATITGSDGRMDGELGGFIPRGMVGVANPLTSETFENSPGAKVMFYLQQGSTYIDGEFAKFSGEEAFGNLKPESKIMIRKPCNTIQPANARARRTPGDEEYTDEYEVLIYLVFQNQEWNNETQKMEPGDEYEIYGKCTMVMHTPKVTRFQVRPEKDWVKVGESMKVNLESFAEEGATWDWNDVELVSQSANYNDAYNGADDGFFTWDPATQTVTSLKSNDNKYVWVYFGLKSNPSVRGSIQIATGEGWKYTMIKPSVDEITDHPNSYLSFSFDFAPRDSEEEKIDFNALEIDPATNPDGYFSLQKTYGPQGWPIFVSSKAQPGEYNIRFWIKSNHDVNCTLKVIITPENE